MQRLCMAWDAGSSPWDWDTETIFAPNHGSGSSFRRASGDNKLGETIFSVNGHRNPPQETDNGRQLGHRTSTVPGATDLPGVGSHAGNLHGYTTCRSSSVALGNTMQGRLPVVTTCVPNGNFIDCNSDYGNVKSENLNLGAAHDNQLSAEYGHTGFLKLGSQESGLGRLQYESVENSTVKNIPNASVKPDPDGNIVSDVSKKQSMEEKSSTTSRSAGSGDSLTGLHLGKRTYNNDVTTATMLTAATTTATPQKAAQKPYSAPKKSRVGSGGSQIPRCQVEGCKADLSSSKDYHRRHKVCELHSKSGKVIVASLEQRFCQQCSRFHVLSEFDEAKRSCRRRLAGHNERRRKPQPNPLALHARLQSGIEDWSFLNQSRFSRLSLWQDPGELRLNGAWPRAAIHLEDQPVYDYQVSGMSTKGLSPSIIHDKFPLLLLQSPKTLIQTDTPSAKVHQYLSSGNSIGNNLTLASVSSSSSAGAEVLSGLETTPVTSLVTRVPDSGRALSLLSLQTRSSQAPHLVSLDPSSSSLSSVSTIDLEHTHESVVPSRWLLQGQQQQQHQPQHCHDLLVMQTSSSGGIQEVSFRSFDNKDLHDYSYLHHSNRRSGIDNSGTVLTAMPYHRLDGTSGGRTV